MYLINTLFLNLKGKTNDSTDYEYEKKIIPD